MRPNLASLLATPTDTLLLPDDWADQQIAQLAATTKGVGALRLTEREVTDAVACAGLWMARDEEAQRQPSAWTLKRRLVQQAVIEWIEATAAGAATQPHEFVEDLLGTEGRLDPLTSTWLLLMGEYQRTELTGLLTGAICRLARNWPDAGRDPRLQLGPAAPGFRSNTVTLVPGMTELVVGWHTADHGGFRPGATLVHLTPDAAAPDLLDRMSLDAVVHGLASGAPPARLLVYGLTYANACTRQMTPDLWDAVAATVRVAVKRIAAARHNRLAIQGGGHCVRCPDRNDCDASEADEYDDPF